MVDNDYWQHRQGLPQFMPYAFQWEFVRRHFNAHMERELREVTRLTEDEELQRIIDEVWHHARIEPETIQKIVKAMNDELNQPLPRHNVSLARINHHWKRPRPGENGVTITHPNGTTHQYPERTQHD